MLKRGVVVEDGTHQQLVALGGEYATLWAMQAHSQGELEEDEPFAS